MRHHKRFFVQIWHGLTNVRPRLNAFDDHTLNETRMVLALNLLACMSEAMMFISILPVIGISTQPSRALHAMLALMLMFSIYIVAQYTVYWIIGFVFASRTLRRQWISGFTSVQSFLASQSHCRHWLQCSIRSTRPFSPQQGQYAIFAGVSCSLLRDLEFFS